MTIGIVNYGIGNVGSVLSAFRFYNYDALLFSDPSKLAKADIIVLAGIGNFSKVVTKLKEAKFWNTLDELVKIKRKPFIGICLGMQIMADIGYEDGVNKGFGWIKGKVIKIEGSKEKIPRIGWGKVNPINKKLFENMRYNYFYFMHSYHFIPEDHKLVSAVSDYGGLNIVATIKKDNIIGTQFHPEKSQGDGLRFLKNAVELLIPS